jgi:hypothetical protein
VGVVSWVLAEEVIAEIRDQFPPAATFYASQDRDQAIWDALTTVPFDPADPRLVVVREAERIRDWAPLEHMLAAYRQLPRCTALFVDGGEQPGRGENPPADTLQGRLLRRSGAAVLVKTSVPGDEELEEWAAALLPEAARGLAAEVLRVTGGDVRAARDLCARLSVLPPDLERRTVSWLAGEPVFDFASAVIAGNRKAAFSAAPLLTSDQLGYAIGTLAGWLDDLAVLAPAAARNATLREIGALGVSQYSALRLLPVVSRYNPAAIHRDRSVLLVAAEAWQSGQRDGVPEVIAALW